MADRVCFVIQPFDGGEFDKRFDDVIAPAAREVGLVPYRVDRNPAVDVPVADIERGIREAFVCVADITRDNPNVFYEVGFAIACNKRLCLVCSDEREGVMPFDVRNRAVVMYDREDSSSYRKSLAGRLSAIIDDDLTVHTSGTAKHLFAIYPDGKVTDEDDNSRYLVRSCEIRQSEGYATASGELMIGIGDVEIETTFSAKGPISDGHAFLQYDGKGIDLNQGWSGLCLLKLAPFGEIVGYWLIVSDIKPGTLSFGEMRLQRTHA